MKMTIIYLMSQAEGALEDGEGTTLQRFDSDTTDAIRQTAESRRWINVDRIFSSAQIRSMLTAEIFSSLYNLPYSVDDTLGSDQACCDGALDKKRWYSDQWGFKMLPDVKGCQGNIRQSMASVIGQHMGKRLLVCLQPMILSLYLNTITPSFDEEKSHGVRPLDFFRVIHSNGTLIYRG